MAGLPKVGPRALALAAPVRARLPNSGSAYVLRWGASGMLRGLYSAAAGLLATGLREGVVADNLANSETPGYKARHAVLASFGALGVNRVQAFPTMLASVLTPSSTALGSIQSGALVDVTAIDWSSGSLTPSDNPLSGAIVGQGFFGIQTPQGVQYTRAGDFHFDAQGTLVNAQGAAVLGVTAQPIVAPGGESTGVPALDASGQVTVGGNAVGRIGIYNPPLAALQPAGQGAFILATGATPPTPAQGTLHPGYVERANVDLIGQMAALLDIQQVFASDQRAVQTADQTMAVALSDVGTVS